MASILQPFNVLNPALFQVPNGSLCVDWTHPLTKGLIGCYVPGAMFGADLANRKPLTYNVASKSSAIWKEGVGMQSSTTDTGMISSGLGVGSEYLTWTSLSCYIRGYSLGTPAGNGLYWQICDNGNEAGGSFFICGLRAGGSNQFAVLWNNKAASNAVNIGAVPIPIPGPISIGISWVATVSGPVILYFGGVNRGSTTWGGTLGGYTISDAAGAHLNLGCHGPVGGISGRYSNSIISVQYTWNRALTDYEMAWLDANPYGFLAPTEGEMPILFIPAAPPSVLFGYNIGGHFSRKVTTIGY